MELHRDEVGIHEKQTFTQFHFLFTQFSDYIQQKQHSKKRLEIVCLWDWLLEYALPLRLVDRIRIRESETTRYITTDVTTSLVPTLANRYRTVESKENFNLLVDEGLLDREQEPPFDDTRKIKICEWKKVHWGWERRYRLHIFFRGPIHLKREFQSFWRMINQIMGFIFKDFA